MTVDVEQGRVTMQERLAGAMHLHESLSVTVDVEQGRVTMLERLADVMHLHES